MRSALLAAVLLLPAGWCVRNEWEQAQTCKREFGSEAETDDFDICNMTGADPNATCRNMDRYPFWCSEGFIEGHAELVALRDKGLFQSRLDCAAAKQVETTTRCSEGEWDNWCATQYHSPRTLDRCRAANPDGPEGTPLLRERLDPSPAVGPRSGPAGECAELRTFKVGTGVPGALVVDDDGSVWFTEYQTGSIGHMTPDGEITRQLLGVRPGSLARGPDGALWFTDPAGNAVWRLDADGAAERVAISETPARLGAPGATGGPGVSEIIAGPDGNIWVVLTEADRIGRIGPDGLLTEVPLAGPKDGHVRPGDIVAGPGRAVWVSLTLGRRIVRVDVDTLQRKEFAVPDGGSGLVKAGSIAAGADGGIWFDNPATTLYIDPEPPSLDRLDPRSGAITAHVLPSTGARWPGSLTTGPDGAVWFIDGSAKAIGRMTAGGTVTEFPYSAPDSQMGGGGGIAAGRDRLWFTEPHSGRIGFIRCAT